MQLTPENIDQLDFEKSPMMPAIVQDAFSGQILMQGFMNYEAIKTTFEKGLITFYSRSKDRLWTKGEMSENYLELVEAHTDCDNDSILLFAKPKGPTCHLGTTSCFLDAKPLIGFLAELEEVIVSRKDGDPNESYTASLFSKDLSRSCQKVGEEGVEVALAAMKQDKEELANESADLLYHLTVLLQRSGLSLADVVNTLKSRHK
jgi:phosphoribosyl-ATP pyrophosphohydrolase/phosphoribosyl-AMP cyclohydrolase